MSQLWFSRQTQSRTVAALASAIALGLGSCTSAPEPGASSTAPETAATETEAELQVVTTFLPITQFTAAVAGDRAEIVQLLPDNTGPHDYQAKPTDAQAIATADVLVQNGLEMEFFLDGLIENADNSDLTIVDSSEGIEVFAFADIEGGAHDHDHDHAEGEAHAEGEDHDHAEGEAHAEGEDHDHAEGEAHAEGEDHDHAEGEDHDHAEGEAHAEGEDHDHAEGEAHAEGGDHHHHHGEFDPHIWLDPKRAIEQVENIRDGLIAADPDGEAEYTANAAAYIEQLEALDEEIAEQLAPYAGQTFISFHDFAFYFADSYDLNAESLVDVPEENPTPEDVRRVLETSEEANLKALLTEPQVGKEAFSALATDLGIGVGVFDPLEVADAEAIAPDYYFEAMRRNADNVEAAFAGTTQSQGWPVWPIAILIPAVKLHRSGVRP